MNKLTLGARAIIPAATLLGLALAAPACGNGDTETDLIAEGKAQVATDVCASCHQSSDAKDGILSGQTVPVSGTTMTYGPNITPDMTTGIGSWTDAQILGALKDGVDDEGETLCATMPKFPLTDDDGKAIIAYLRSIPAVKREIPDSTCQ